MLAAVCGLVVGILPAQGQKVKMGSAAPAAVALPDTTDTNVVVLPPVVVTAAMADDPAAAKAWKKLVRDEKAIARLPFIFDLKLMLGTLHPEDIANFEDKHAIPEDLKKADLARDFYTRFPYYSKAWDARVLEYDNLENGCAEMSIWDEVVVNLQQSGLAVKPPVWTFTNLVSRMIALEQALMANTNLSSTNQFTVRIDRVDRLSFGPEDDFLAALKELQRDFPQQLEAYQFIADNEDEMRALATNVIDSAAPEKAKARMRDILRQLDLKGKPATLHFTALNGREVNTADMKGKVVLVAFWEPSELLELSSEKAIYEKFHAQGLEIIGVNLGDAEDKDKLTELLKKQKIPWPQYFDGKGMDGNLARQFVIFHTPALLLLDKQGLLRDINLMAEGIWFGSDEDVNNDGIVSTSFPPGSLEEKIKRLLAEP
jgi:hypothetical protein